MARNRIVRWCVITACAGVIGVIGNTPNAHPAKSKLTILTAMLGMGLVWRVTR